MRTFTAFGLNQIFFSLLLLILMDNTSAAQSPDEAQLIEAIERLRVVMEKPDSVILADLVSDNLEYVHSSGTVRDKQGFINEFMKKQTRVTNVKFSNQTVRFSSDLAVVRHRMEADAHNPGYPPKLDIIILMVWKKEGGKWKMLARQAAKLPEGVSQSKNESVIFYRIESFYQSKKEIMDKAWPSVKDTVFNSPFIYFTDTSSYIVNPTEKFILKLKPELKFQKDNLKIYKTKSRMDSIPFHMEVRVSDVETDYNYNFPFGKMSGLEETRKIIPDLPVEAWSGMVLHEFFHGYQFRHLAFWKHAYDTKLIYSVINDSLERYYHKHDWYKKGIDEENALILKATQEKDKKLRRSLIGKMFIIRDERRKQVLEKFDRSIAFYEKSFETMEGTARYIEIAVLKNFFTLKLSENLKNSDPNFNIQHHEGLAEPEWAFKTEVSQSYTYAMGYNMAKLLDALRIEYKGKLFKDPSLTLEDLLRGAIK